MNNQQPNLQDPIEAAEWLKQAWVQTRPPVDANQMHTLMMATAINTVVTNIETLVKQLHDLRNDANTKH